MKKILLFHGQGFVGNWEKPESNIYSRIEEAVSEISNFPTIDEIVRMSDKEQKIPSNYTLGAFAIQVALSQNEKPDAVLGNSAGVYAAINAAKWLELEELAQIVAKRGLILDNWKENQEKNNLKIEEQSATIFRGNISNRLDKNTYLIFGNTTQMQYYAPFHTPLVYGSTIEMQKWLDEKNFKPKETRILVFSDMPDRDFYRPDTFFKQDAARHISTQLDYFSASQRVKKMQYRPKSIGVNHVARNSMLRPI